MKILLATPPSRPIVRDMAGGLGFDSSLFNVLPPLDLVLMATILQNKKHKVLILDCLAEKINAVGFFARAQKFSPTHFIISVSLPTLATDCQFIRQVREKFPRARIIVKFGLNDKKIIHEVLAKSRADYCVTCDNEPLIEKILTGKPVVQKLLRDLDSLPIPDRKLVKNNLYHYHLLGKSPTTSVQTSRGCPMPCGFYCPYPLVQGKIWRARSVTHVIKELIDIVKNHKIKNILFRDATFTLNRNRIINLCGSIKKEKLPIRFWCETRINYLDFVLLKAMKEAGLQGMNIGVETGDEKLMTALAKPGISLPQLAQVKVWCDKLDIKLNFLMMIGLPADSKSSINKTWILLKKFKPHFMGLTIATPYPGTRFYQLCQKNHWLGHYAWEDYGGHKAIICTQFLTQKDLQFAYHIINDLFYLLKNPSIKNKIKFILKEREFKQWLAN